MQFDWVRQQKRAFAVMAGVLALTGFASQSETDGPSLASVSAMVTHLDSGEVLVSKHADVVMPIASLTKVMTALVVVESGADLDEYSRIQDWHKKQQKNAFSHIRIDSMAKRRDLLKIALMSSEKRFDTDANAADLAPGLASAAAAFSRTCSRASSAC